MTPPTRATPTTATASPANTTSARPAGGHPKAAAPTVPAGGLRPPRPHRRPLHLPPWLLLPLLIIPLAARSLWPEPYPTVPLPPLACDNPEKGLLTIVVDDRSGSTYRTDPDRRREPEIRQVVHWLDQADCHPDDAVAVAQFDNVLPPLTPARLDDGLERILAAIPDTAPESSSTLTGPVTQATAWAEQHPDLQPVLLIATDGELADYDTAFPALDAFPGPVNILALGGPLAADWDRAAVTDGITELRGQVVLGDVARPLAQLLQPASTLRNKDNQ